MAWALGRVMAFVSSGRLMAMSVAAIALLFLRRLARRLRSTESSLATSRMAAASLALAPIVLFAVQLLDEAGLDADIADYTIVQPLPQPHWKALLFLS